LDDSRTTGDDLALWLSSRNLVARAEVALTRYSLGAAQPPISLTSR
jgi:hypothetical protein